MGVQVRALIVLAVIAALFMVLRFAGVNLPLGRLPGDIIVKRENFSFYLPLTTCILLGLVLSLVLSLWRR